MTAPPEAQPLADLDERRREQRGWYFYDFANSAYVTTVGTVLFAPYLTAVAETAACGPADSYEGACRTNIDVLGFIPVAPGSLVFYLITVSTICAAIIAPIVGAVADRTSRKKQLMAGFAWVGSAATVSMFFVTGSNWQLGALLLFVGNICLISSLTIYDAILCQIATPDERDGVSSRGWALGYLGGGFLLAINLGLVSFAEPLGVGTGLAVRIAVASAGVWWAAWTVIPFIRLHDRPVPAAEAPAGGKGVVRSSFGQLVTTLKGARAYPMTLLFLAAYLLYNDGIQTVIAAASIYGQQELGFSESILILTILIVQFVAFGGALIFGQVAMRVGSRKTILAGLLVWVGIVAVGYFLPAGQMVPFLLLAVAIGLVLGGTQALSRSFFSQLVPRGREAEYFSLYQAAERGTSWFGTLLFGLVFQITGSYRPALVALAIFFVAGFVLLLKVDPRRAIRDAGNEMPTVV